MINNYINNDDNNTETRYFLVVVAKKNDGVRNSYYLLYSIASVSLISSNINNYSSLRY